ncbi:MAG: hypothetical protein M1118_08750 [Chloroflexi bacterium]|nr:hypothetical protein [Chloroflexota bacterium]
MAPSRGKSNGMLTGTITETESGASAPKPRRSLMDFFFPAKPGMPEPPWSRVIGLIITMAVIWEVIWFVTYYFTGPTAHNLAKTAQAVLDFFPLALAFSALGSIPGFWLMRRRIRAANATLAAEEEKRRELAHQRPSTIPSSSRARRRQAAKARRHR